jgi:hypothetical protein
VIEKRVAPRREVETMKYRRSDGRLDDYGPDGPF